MPIFLHCRFESKSNKIVGSRETLVYSKHGIGIGLFLEELVEKEDMAGGEDENDVAGKMCVEDMRILYGTWHLYFLMLTNLLWATLV